MTIETEPSVESRGYTIRVVSRMTGLSVDTLRMWERRYEFPVPTRNTAGNRIYSESDVARLTAIARAIRVGYRPGEAIRCDDQQLAALSSSPAHGGEPLGSGSEVIEEILHHSKGCDIEPIRDQLKTLTGALGARRFVTEVAAPLLEALGNAWTKGELQIHQEHLLTDLLWSHLRSTTQLFETRTGPRILMATLPREQHRLGLEMAALMATVAGATVVHVGTELPTNELVAAARALGVQAVALSISEATAAVAATSQLEWLAERLPPALALWIGGKGAARPENLPSRVRVVECWQDLDEAVLGLVRGR